MGRRRIRPIQIVVAVATAVLVAAWAAWVTGLVAGDVRWSRLGALAFAAALAVAVLPLVATLVDLGVEKLRGGRRPDDSDGR